MVEKWRKSGELVHHEVRPNVRCIIQNVNYGLCIMQIVRKIVIKVFNLLIKNPKAESLVKLIAMHTHCISFIKTQVKMNKTLS